MASDGTIVIKRIKKGGHGGHHGCAWKVAYADFVMAMMAFFLLMWLINTTTPEQKRGIADYFAPQSISQTVSGSGGVLGGTVLGKDGPRAGGVQSLYKNNSPSSPDNPPQAKSGQDRSSAAANAQNQSATSQGTSSQTSPSTTDADFASAAESIRQAMQQMP